MRTLILLAIVFVGGFFASATLILGIKGSFFGALLMAGILPVLLAVLVSFFGRRQEVRRRNRMILAIGLIYHVVLMILVVRSGTDEADPVTEPTAALRETDVAAPPTPGDRIPPPPRQRLPPPPSAQQIATPKIDRRSPAGSPSIVCPAGTTASTAVVLSAYRKPRFTDRFCLLPDGTQHGPVVRRDDDDRVVAQGEIDRGLARGAWEVKTPSGGVATHTFADGVIVWDDSADWVEGVRHGATFDGGVRHGRIDGVLYVAGWAEPDAEARAIIEKESLGVRFEPLVLKPLPSDHDFVPPPRRYPFCRNPRHAKLRKVVRADKDEVETFCVDGIGRRDGLYVRSRRQSGDEPVRGIFSTGKRSNFTVDGVQRKYRGGALTRLGDRDFVNGYRRSAPGGAFKEGARQGRWVFRRQDGSKASQRDFAAGRVLKGSAKQFDERSLLIVRGKKPLPPPRAPRPGEVPNIGIVNEILERIVAAAMPLDSPVKTFDLRVLKSVWKKRLSMELRMGLEDLSLKMEAGARWRKRRKNQRAIEVDASVRGRGNVFQTLDWSDLGEARRDLEALKAQLAVFGIESELKATPKRIRFKATLKNHRDYPEAKAEVSLTITSAKVDGTAELSWQATQTEVDALMEGIRLELLKIQHADHQEVERLERSIAEMLEKRSLR